MIKELIRSWGSTAGGVVQLIIIVLPVVTQVVWEVFNT